MQIKTGITLAVGVGIGIFVGMGVSEDAKERLAKHIRDRLIYMLTGEKQKPKKPVDYKDFRAKYSSYSKPKENWEDCLIFPSEEDAFEFKNQMLKLAHNYKAVSVHEVCLARGKCIEYTWDMYGWTEDEIIEWAVAPGDRGPSGALTYHIVTSEPKLLKT